MAKQQQLSRKAIVGMIVGAAVILALILLAIFSFTSQQAGASQQRGNSVGNVSNYGLVVAEEDGTVYYTSNGILKMDADGNVQELAPVSAMSLNLWDGWLYYSNFGDGGKVYRMKTDGTKNTALSTVYADGINIVDGVVYFTAANDSDSENIGIYRMNLDGSDQERITRDEARDLVVYGDRIYFVNANDEYRLYSMNLTGGDRKVLATELCNSINIKDGWIYYASSSGIYKVRTDGAAKRQLSEMPSSTIQVAGDYIYHGYMDVLNTSGSSEQSYLYRMSLDGKNDELVQEDLPMSICSIGEDIYYQVYTADVSLKRLVGGEGEPETLQNGTYESDSEEESDHADDQSQGE